MDLQLTGKTALVTGSTSGIGLAIAQRFAEEGANVIICGRSQSKLEAALKTFPAPEKVKAVLADAGSQAGIDALTKEVPAVDILINNLGIFEPKAFSDITDDEWHHIFEVNVMSGVRLSRYYFPKMIEKNWGRIIFVSSECGVVTPGDTIHYAMTKTAQLAISRGLAEETKGTAVTVNTILPGPTKSEGSTAFIRAAVANDSLSEEEMEAEFFKKMRPLSLLQRRCDPAEIAAQVALLCSPFGAITNGAAIRLEGGIIPTIL
ncbi:short-chain dehydrogenase/reductase SDR [Zymomonas mobilis subsp. mobilis ZM4 = ATCC 31821]|uniref:Short-chain dehydrogenase/reductase SDR n=1 Tax=Zymomonas mobilis subsp. mobilis (strain ATCC 31821 / ZM4 / CP4) TaxID=264203 RepID=Q5NPD9_ZYMMO|nr:SDR family oxidoreductase [Zymomonas mobilis]AAV89421.1 short-chain dehydrogenase/reductase SDR [Zymomonas mobilis subsp. mobilis ZM4 = ATCC 31821]AVZ25730.1 short-chain dehydrogenase/reductase SDR [Zymomonas mobilis subsp. mobilis]AVZ27621.1 short-chain dehydrogenase/reductase SDR [Zymomonas mobilis subsp. mobilis]AVZ42067.1 short-chain dehydrogenase/reductase SDR [Zymomonas mobilis subsp. mobilis ZM4 = ATCC 31821]UBQ08536.1 SDR family oxidoreductase [Zymomonas mobilis]